jgi:hypothetical protein
LHHASVLTSFCFLDPLLSGATQLARALARNTALTHLDLAHNRVGSALGSTSLPSATEKGAGC